MRVAWFLMMLIWASSGLYAGNGPLGVDPETEPDWGFFGHRRINRLAVFTLPPDMMPLFKRQLPYIEEHAVDPDKRRYASKFEAIRHYIDADHWDKYPFPNIPRKFEDALIKFGKYQAITDRGDTLDLGMVLTEKELKLNLRSDTFLGVSYWKFARFFKKVVYPQYYEDEWVVPLDSLNAYFEDVTFPKRMIKLKVVDKFSEYGILPYYLELGLARLTRAFAKKSEKEILRHAADLGHYVGDAHVPLHTTENYNGQLTNQVGIHAFWESRIPELFADKQYDFYVGKAKYISDPNAYFWDIILKSHSHLDSVLAIEKRLSQTFPADKQWCYEDRLNQNVRIQCTEYTAAYHEALRGMVEERMAASISAIGDVWYTAWVDAGQPDLRTLTDQEIIPEEIKKDDRIKTREHEN